MIIKPDLFKQGSQPRVSTQAVPAGFVDQTRFAVTATTSTAPPIAGPAIEPGIHHWLDTIMSVVPSRGQTVGDPPPYVEDSTCYTSD